MNVNETLEELIQTNLNSVTKFILFNISYYNIIYTKEDLQLSIANYKNTILTTNRINCGVMIFKVSNFCLEFLEKVWSKKEYINHFWYEQAAIMDLVGLKADITGNLNDNKGNDFYLNKIKFLSKEWNSIPSFGAISSESIRPSIIHLAGIENDERIKLLNDYIKRGKI